MNLMRYKPPSFIFQNYKLFTTLKKYTKKIPRNLNIGIWFKMSTLFVCLFINIQKQIDASNFIFLIFTFLIDIRKY